mgnify:CR=1 FL=1
MILSVIYAQDRSLIFTTGAPLGSCFPSNNPCNTDGDCLLGETCNPPASYTIEFDGTSGQSVSDRIFINGNMVLEALKIYAREATVPAMARVLLQADNGGVPGEEIYSWDVDVSEETHGNNYFLIRLATGVDGNFNYRPFLVHWVCFFIYFSGFCKMDTTF